MNFENNLIIDVLKSRKQEVTVDYFFHIPNNDYYGVADQVF